MNLPCLQYAQRAIDSFLLVQRKQRVITFEGPDKVYKSTLAKLVSYELGNDRLYYKASGEHDTFLNGQDKFLMQLRYADPRMVDYLTQSGNSIVMDRHIASEYSYAKFFKRKTDFNVILSLDAKLAALGAKIVFCTRRSFKGVSDQMHNSLTEDALAQISRFYDDYMHITKCKVLKVYVDDMIVRLSPEEQREIGRYERVIEEKKNEIVHSIMEFVK